MDRLNIFYPYENKPAHFEDQLTRAYLCLLRHVPLAHAERVPALGRMANKVDLRTQVKSIEHEAGHLVSVLISDDR
jgi:hypothetical protein